MRSSKISPFATKTLGQCENLCNFKWRKEKTIFSHKKMLQLQKEGNCKTPMNIWMLNVWTTTTYENKEEKKPNSMNKLKTIIYRSSCPLGNHMPLFGCWTFMCYVSFWMYDAGASFVSISKCIIVSFRIIFISLSPLVELWALIFMNSLV